MDLQTLQDEWYAVLGLVVFDSGHGVMILFS